jgi:hypothetical protein
VLVDSVELLRQTQEIPEEALRLEVVLSPMVAVEASAVAERKVLAEEVEEASQVLAPEMVDRQQELVVVRQQEERAQFLTRRLAVAPVLRRVLLPLEFPVMVAVVEVPLLVRLQ